jgi:hypothetical protein
MRFLGGVNRDDIEAYMEILETENVRHDFDRAFKRFSESMDMIMLFLGQAVGHFQLQKKVSKPIVLSYIPLIIK